MIFETIFENVKNKFINTDVSKFEGKTAIQITLTGEGGGTFYIEVLNGKLSIEPFTYNDRDVAIIISIANFEKILSGKLDPAMAFLTGKFKTNGDTQKALLLKEFI